MKKKIIAVTIILALALEMFALPSGLEVSAGKRWMEF